MDFHSSGTAEFKVFIGGLPKNSDEQSLSLLLSTFGKVINLKIARKYPDFKCLGYAYATVSEEMFNACVGQKDIPYKKVNLAVKPYMSGEKLKNYLDGFNSKRIFINKLSKKITVNQLKKTFKQLGELETVYIRKSNSNLCNTGVLIFKKEKVAQKVHDLVNKSRKGTFANYEVSYKFVEKKNTNTNTKRSNN